MRAFYLIILFCFNCYGDLTVYQLNKIADGIYIAEGGDKARVPFGILTVKVKDKADARKICINTITKNYQRWANNNKPDDFIIFLGSKYAPIGAKNDPKGLNKSWVYNLKRILGKEFVISIK